MGLIRPMALAQLAWSNGQSGLVGPCLEHGASAAWWRTRRRCCGRRPVVGFSGGASVEKGGNAGQYLVEGEGAGWRSNGEVAERAILSSWNFEFERNLDQGLLFTPSIQPKSWRRV
jgi:hypothetical protein